MLGTFILGIVGVVLLCLGFAVDVKRQKERRLLVERVEKLEKSRNS